MKDGRAVVVLEEEVAAGEDQLYVATPSTALMVAVGLIAEGAIHPCPDTTLSMMVGAETRTTLVATAVQPAALVLDVRVTVKLPGVV